MSRRTVWVAAFLAVTGTAVVMECWAAWDSDPSTVPWTDLIADYIPRPVTFAAIALLCAWLPAHFAWAYRHKSSEGGAMKYAKAGVAVLTAALTAAQAALPMSDAAHSYVAVALTVLGAVGVLLVPNKTAPAAPEGVTGTYGRKF